MGPDNPDFDAFVRNNVDGLRRTAYLIAWDAKEAEDLVQECLFKISRRWGRVSAMDEPLGYTRRVLVRLATRGSKARERRRSELDTTTTELGAESRALS